LKSISDSNYNNLAINAVLVKKVAGIMAVATMVIISSRVYMTQVHPTGLTADINILTVTFGCASMHGRELDDPKELINYSIKESGLDEILLRQILTTKLKNQFYS